MVRKSPFRHKVRSYLRRNGTRVDLYHRGKGKKPREGLTGGGRRPSARMPSKRTGKKAVSTKGSRVRRGLKAPGTPFRDFNVTVTFGDGKTESVPSLKATSYAGAIDKGLGGRKRGGAVKSVLVRRVV